MEVRDMNMEELEARVSELDALVEAAEDVEAVERAKEELAQIAERRAELVEIETRKAEAEALNRGAEVPDILIEKREETKMDEMIYTRDSREYRNAFLNNLRGVELSEVEQRAFAVAGSAIATETANDIMQVIRDHAPILDKLTVVYSPAKVAYYVEGDIKDAESHVENAAITAAADTLVKVDLNPAELVKMVQISEAVKMMSVDAFETWIANQIGQAIARKMNALIIAAITPSTPVASTITAADIQKLLGAVKGNISVLCNRKTFFTKIVPLQDNSKTTIVKFDGGEASIYGCPVLLDDNVTDDTVIAGDLSKGIAALAEDVVIRSNYDIDTNSYKYLGVALFDVKAGYASAFASLA